MSDTTASLRRKISSAGDLQSVVRTMKALAALPEKSQVWAVGEGVYARLADASHLVAMQRADKNIEELLDTLQSDFHRLRQSSIDEELFDVISGFEALSKEKDR